MMKKLFNRIPFNNKLILSTGIPIAVLIVAFFFIRNERRVRNETTNNFIKRLELTMASNKLTNSIYLERRFSMSKLLGRDANQNLESFRASVDQAIQELATNTNSVTSKDVREYSFIDDLKAWRLQIDSSQISAGDVFDNYQLIIDQLQSNNTLRSDNPSIKDRSESKIIASGTLSYMGNILTQLRLRAYLSLVGRHELANSFEQNYKLFQSLEAELLRSGDQHIVERYTQLREEGGLGPMLIFFDELLAGNTIDAAYSSEDWWRLSATSVDELKALQESFLNEVRQETTEYYNDAIVIQRTLVAIIGIAALLAILLIAYFVRSTTSQVNQLRIAAGRMAKGETDIKLPRFPKDAFGSLANSFLQIDRNNKKIEIAASAIGDNNFDVDFQPRSKKDDLGHTIMRMRNSLKNFSEANEREIWVQTGLSTINGVLIGHKRIDESCEVVLSTLVDYLNAEVGTMYLHNYSNTLELQASYAILNEEKLPRLVKIGQNRLGKAAENKKPLIIDSVPDDYLAVGSSLGESQPKHLLMLPLIQSGEIEGVIEIASFNKFPSGTGSFLKQVGGNIASMIQSMKSRTRLQELLEETQTQTEELQTQHSELENLNTELEAQAQKLQASEEELKVQQEELLQANQELEERSNLLEDRNQIIIDRNLEIQKKAEELELSTRYKSEFLANMSHELRTPLNSILLLSRLLSENGDNNLSGDQVEYAHVIQNSGKSLLSLIDEILDLSKIEAGKMAVEFEPEPIQEVMTSMQSLFGELAKEKHLDLQFTIGKDVPQVITTDRLRLEQILKNLLSNSLKFTTKGFIHLDVTEDKTQAGYIKFSVKDSGIGIAPDKQEHIFGAFQQADGSTRRMYGGTGLGLAISRELARLLGGTLTVSSKEGVGSEFILSVPIEGTESVEEEIANEQIETPTTVEEMSEETAVVDDDLPTEEDEQTFVTSVIPENVPDDRKSIKKDDNIILIIEDDTAFAKSLLSFTQKKGYKGIVAVRGDEGIEMAFRYNPQAILLDLQLPIKDGWQVMKELKENPKTRHIPVHMMSSYEIRKESLKKGAIDFINKPVAFEQMNEIFKKLEKVLERGSKKVLIIEENPKHAAALAQYLSTFNVKSEIRDEIKTGIETLHREDVDCVILDMGIPDEIGYKTLEAVKDNPGLDNLPIIVFTGKNLSRIEERKIKQYADSIVVKTAHSYQRILDEVTLFLHLVEENKETEGKKRKPTNNTGRFNEILAGKTVLIADDDIRNIFSLTKALEHFNMNVLTANDGTEALDVLEANIDQVDIILMDMMMPQMDGYETTTRIRKNPKLSGLPILAVTAKAMVGDREKCIRAGASDYISKPVDIDQLISLLRVWLYP